MARTDFDVMIDAAENLRQWKITSRCANPECQKSVLYNEFIIFDYKLYCSKDCIPKLEAIK